MKPIGFTLMTDEKSEMMKKIGLKLVTQGTIAELKNEMVGKPDCTYSLIYEAAENGHVWFLEVLREFEQKNPEQRYSWAPFEDKEQAKTNNLGTFIGKINSIGASGSDKLRIDKLLAAVNKLYEE